MSKEFLESLVGRSNGPRTLHYTWRDIALYALGIGAHKEDLQYVYEGSEMKALPTFAFVPYINSINLEPHYRIPRHPATLVRNILADVLKDESLTTLHMSIELTMHKEIDPLEGTFLCEDKVANIYDRGEGKGIAVETQMDLYDIAGNPVATLNGMHMIAACGGFGGEPVPNRKLLYPEREPDYTVDEKMQDTQHLLYRLSGDLNEVHADPEAAQKKHFKEAFMQGLCSCGFAGRMAIGEISPGKPENMTYLYAQMRTICYPGECVHFRGWKMESGKVYFKLLNDEGKAILDNGLMCFANLYD